MINQRRSMLIAEDSVYNRLKRTCQTLGDRKASKVSKSQHLISGQISPANQAASAATALQILFFVSTPDGDLCG